MVSEPDRPPRDSGPSEGPAGCPRPRRVASPEERAGLWPRLVDLYADFARYQGWTDREIPVIILAPR
ncbi:nitroreductase/quinone reductase family protein [Pseudofrankia sp. BMG5.37]|nr:MULTISPECIES: nitroreductase/quinone reductase family protein [unclassified Pseudofrankia]MDT3445564.1 nitroreductase/quinone reductase family protein [Pseudofrankia sp. BMG5.37]